MFFFSTKLKREWKTIFINNSKCLQGTITNLKFVNITSSYRLRSIKCDICNQIEFVKITDGNNISLYNCNMCRNERVENLQRKLYRHMKKVINLYHNTDLLMKKINISEMYCSNLVSKTHCNFQTKLSIFE